ncbi:hypothetical protein SEUCBS139899_002833 [Sporothrix eucalyptigena]
MSSTPSSLVATSRANKASEYRHIPLQQQDSIRLLRLLPSTDNNAPVQCQLSEYPLQGPHDEVHLYEALSYVWGSTSNQQTIYVQSEGDAKDRFQTLLVTFNLHVALKHLRSRHIARTIWIDAVCIDQQNNAEKGQQVQMMAKVYNFADRVIVWLGDATDKGDQALIDICKAASQQHARTPIDASASSQEAIIKLLQRPWFQRIWIRPLAELVDMYHTRATTEPLDRFYALFGMSTDDLGSAGLFVDYSVAWRDVFERVVRLATSDQVVINTWDRKQVAFVRGNACVLVMGGEEAIVKLILDCGMDVDTQDVFHYTALLWAADVGNVFVVQLLLDRGTDIELKNKVGRSALFLAAAAGHVAIVKLLLDKGANVHTVDFLGSTPLLATALCGYKPQFYFNFIGKKSSVHAKNDLSVALPRATASEYVEAARLLLDEGANIEAKDRDQRTPLDLASRRGHTALIELLIDRGADIQGTKYHRSTPLIHAITGRHQAAVQLLLDKGADVLVKKAGVKTTLDATVLDAAGAAGDEKIMKLLLDRGAEQFPDIQGGDACYCALRSAAWNGHQAVMQLLLDRGTDINALDSRGNLLLAVAAECNGADAVQRLLDKGADIDATNGKGKTPLLEAIMIGYDDLGDHSTSHHKVIHLLLDRGANVNVKDKYGTSPLLAAIQAGDKAIVEVLLRKGAHIESKGYGGQTPLIRAVENGDKEIVQLLLDKGANVDPKDDAAIKGGKEDVVLCGGVTARGTWRLGPVGRGSGYAGGGAW